MTRRDVAVCVLWLLFLPLLHAAERAPLTRFYIVTFDPGGSDVIPPHKLSTILEAVQEGTDVRVRAIVVEFAARADCMQSDVLKTEKLLRNTRVADVAGLNLCAWHVADVDRFTDVDGMEEGALDNNWGTGVVAVCDDREKLFRIPPSMLDKRKIPKPVQELMEFQSKVTGKVFPPSGYNSLYDIVSHSPGAQHEGEEFLGELRSGMYDEGYWGGTRKTYLDDALAEYHGPRENNRWVKVRLPDDVRLVGGERMAYPPLAAQARIQGEVEASLRADPDSGRVVSQTILSGQPMLAAVVSSTVAVWQFEPSAALSAPIRVTFEFSLDQPCRAEDER